MYGIPTIARFAWPLALLAIGLVLPLFVQADYYFFIANLILLNIVLAIGMDLLIGWAGQFAFAHVAFFSIGAYGTALLQMRLGLPFVVAMPVAAALAGILGYLIAIPSTRLRHIYLALATFAFAEAWQWLLNSWDAVTGGPNGMQIPAAQVFGVLVQGDRIAFPFMAALCALMVAATMLLTSSRLGRSMCAIRESEPMAAACGVDVYNTKILAFVISAVYAGVAGGMLTLFQSFVGPERFGFVTLVLLLSMIVVGGLGTVPGVVVGVVFLTLLPEGMRVSLREPLIWQEAVYGLILMLCMVFMPRGIWGIVQGRWARRKGGGL
jgi:branched-chain amino acid transport system permease protein